MEFGYVVVQSPLHDQSVVDEIIAPVEAWLSAAGGSRASRTTASEQPLLILVATGGTEASILEVVTQRHQVSPAEPVVLICHPRHNSLPASLEAMARLRSDGCRGLIVPFDTPGEPQAALRSVRAARRLQGARLGLVGKPSEWLVASVPDGAAVRDRWGVELIDVDVSEAIDGFESADRARSREVAVKLTRGPEPDSEVLVAAQLYPALSQVIETYAVDAVTVRCFDFLTELHTSGCVALAELNDTGVVAGCEGDVASAVAMMLVRALFDAPSWIANPASIDGDQLVLAHCTIAPSLVQRLETSTHFESGLGIGLRGSFAPGEVTLIRLGGSALEKHWLAEATIVESGAAPDLCRTQVTLEVEPGKLADVLNAPLGNHIVMCLGRHRAEIEEWLQLMQG